MVSGLPPRAPDLEPERPRQPIRSMTRVTLLATLSGAALGAVPQYDAPQLQARANFSGAYNLPNAAFFTNASPEINDLRRVVFRLGVISGTNSQGVWYGGDGQGSILYLSPNVEDSRVGDPSISNTNEIVTDQSNASPSGVIRIAPDSGSATVLINPGFPFGVEAFSTVQVNDSGQIGFRGRVGFLGNIWVSWSNGQQVAHAAEIGVDPTSPYSFLFTPAFNNARQIAGKVRLAPGLGNERPDQIRVFNSDGTSSLIAEDRDSNISSPYSAFDNSVALTSDGRVAFIANLVAGGRGVFLSDGVNTVTIATTAHPGVSNIEFFRPAANDHGLVVFRAFNGAGKRASSPATDHPGGSRDAGRHRADRHRPPQISENNPNDPAFGGSPGVNNNGDVVFSAALIRPATPRWSTAQASSSPAYPRTSPATSTATGSSTSPISTSCSRTSGRAAHRALRRATPTTTAWSTSPT